MVSRKMFFAEVDFQGEVKSPHQIEQQLLSSLNLEPFPTNAKLDFSSDPNYSGLKVFPLKQYICFSYFFYSGNVDRFDRPVLSARVIGIAFHNLSYKAFDVFAIRNILISHSHELTTESQLNMKLEELSAFSDFSTFSNTIKQYDRKFIAKCVNGILKNDRGIIQFENITNAFLFLRTIFLLIPISVLKNKSFVTECENPGSEIREDFVFTQITRKSKSSFAIKDYFKKKDHEEMIIDITKSRIKHARKDAGLELLISEMINHTTWYNIDWVERYLLLKELLEGYHTDEKINFIRSSDKLVKMNNTMKIVESLNKKFGDKHD